MSTSDTDSFLQPITADAPCGDDLEYDPAFTELERMSRGTSKERAVGPEVAPEGPDWKLVRNKAAALLARTKDLRVGVVWTKASLHLDGLDGLQAGLAVLRSMLERYWDALHPRLSPEDGNDPLMRINVLKELCDREGVLNVVRAAPLVKLAGLGSFSLRDVAIASGELTPAAGGEAAPPDMARIEAAFANCELAELEATLAAIRGAASDAAAIEAFVTDKGGAQNALSLEELRSLLGRAERVLDAQLGRRGAGTAASGNGHANGHGAGAQPAASARAVAVGSISSRADVVRVHGQLCEYYQMNEPSSPVPLLLRRAQRLVSMSFMDIVRDLAPAGVSEIETLRGPQDTD